MRTITTFALVVCGMALPPCEAAEPLPFSYKTSTYRDADSKVTVFAVRLEQPFLAEEFEKSNFLRLQSLSERSYLIYPKATKFSQKHAEFYGRLRGKPGTKAKLRLSYEIVSENLDGSRKVDLRETQIEVVIPDPESGSRAAYRQWAMHQNQHFSDLLRFYPETSFFEYVLLQSQERYGVTPPPLPKKPDRSSDATETDLYHIFSGGLAVQQALQRETLSTTVRLGDLNVHISQLTPPNLRSLDYQGLLEKKLKEGIKPSVPAIAQVIPADQYFLHFNSMTAANDLMDLSTEWGESLLRMFTVSARDHHLREKYEDQLCVRRGPLGKLFADGVIAEMVVTGSDFFIAEGTDVTLVFRLKRADLFHKAADSWLAAIKQKYPNMLQQRFNYRGHQVAARYTADRMVSSFVVYKDDYAIFSNSGVAIKKMVDTMIEPASSLHGALDFRYISTILPPADDPQSAYLYGSEAFLRRLVSPQFKIAEKRRLQSFNNLVMLNNASMFYRLEHGKSPDSLSELVEGRFYNPGKIVDPTGGAYAYDAVHDTATSSIYNRIKYLTPIMELNVQNVSANEQAQYERYKKRYEAFWQTVFDPVAVRITTGRRVKLETCVLPFANGSLYSDLRALLDKTPQPIGTADIAKSAVASMVLVPGRKRIGEFLRAIPGVSESLAADPTLTDLSWLGDRVSLHFLDDDTVLEIDPTQLKELQLFGNVPVSYQAAIAAVVAATSMPAYFTVDVENEEKAARLLKLLSSKIFLKSDKLLGLKTRLDAYQVPDYKGHQVYVLSYQLYAVKIRLHVALVGGKLVAATKQRALREVIDAAANKESAEPQLAHAMIRLNFRAMDRLKGDLQLYWGEKLRQAAHRNIMPIYNLIVLYDVPIGGVNKLADAKYGVTYFCPGGGQYKYDAKLDQVYSTVYGNRRNARQPLTIDDKSSFSKFIDSLDEIEASFRFTDDGLIATVVISRREAGAEKE